MMLMADEEINMFAVQGADAGTSRGVGAVRGTTTLKVVQSFYVTASF